MGGFQWFVVIFCVGFVVDLGRSVLICCCGFLLSWVLAIVGPVAIVVANASALAVVGSVGGWFCLWSWYEF